MFLTLLSDEHPCHEPVIPVAAWPGYIHPPEQIIMNFRYYFPLWLAISLAFVACGDDTTAPPSVVPIIRPALGAAFVYSSVVTDTAGAEIASTRHPVVDSVVDINESFLGRDSVVRLVVDGGEFRVSYQADGDIAIPWQLTNDSAEPPRWLLLPVSTGGTITLPAVVQNDGSVVTTFNLSAAYIAGDSLTIGGRTYSAAKVRVTQTTVDQAGGVEITRKDIIDFSFAPDLGYFIRSESVYVDRDRITGGLRRVLVNH